MRLIVAKDYNDVSRKAANIIAAQVHLKPDARSIGLFADSYDSEQAAELMALSKKTIERLLRKKP